MVENFLRYGVITEDDLYKIRKEIEDSPNVVIDASPQYESVVAGADCYITDYSSMIMEMFPTQRPMIYLGSETPFLKYNRKVYETFYHLSDQDDIGKVLQSLIQGKDIKKPLRDEAVNEMSFLFEGNAGNRILDVLLGSPVRR